MASRGVNKVIIVGNLGNDPDVKYSNGGGSPITRISVATSEQWTDKNTQQKQERTEWHRVVFFGRLAEIAGEYLRKGSKVYLEGSLRTSKYTDQAGVEKFSTDIVANEMQMLDSRGDNAGMGAGGMNQGYGQPQQAQQSQQQSPQGGYNQNSAAGAFAAGAAVAGAAAASQQPAQAVPAQPAHQNQNNDVPSMDFDDDVPF